MFDITTFLILLKNSVLRTKINRCLYEEINNQEKI